MTKSIMPSQTHLSVSTANVDSYIASAYQIPVLDVEHFIKLFMEIIPMQRLQRVIKKPLSRLA